MPERTTPSTRRAARAKHYLTYEELCPSTRDLITLEAIEAGNVDWIDEDEANAIIDEIVYETEARQ